MYPGGVQARTAARKAHCCGALRRRPEQTEDRTGRWPIPKGQVRAEKAEADRKGETGGPSTIEAAVSWGSTSPPARRRRQAENQQRREPLGGHSRREQWLVPQEGAPMWQPVSWTLTPPPGSPTAVPPSSLRRSQAHRVDRRQPNTGSRVSLDGEVLTQHLAPLPSTAPLSRPVGGGSNRLVPVQACSRSRPRLQEPRPRNLGAPTRGTPAPRYCGLHSAQGAIELLVAAARRSPRGRRVET